MTAYYNEFDAFAAAWLRELIADGLIAPGDVDERSIVDVSADDLRGYVQHHFSPVSVDGATPSDSPGGTTTDPSGPDHVPVSRFRSLDSSEAMPTADTSGPLFSSSSPSAALQQFLESRLRRNLEGSGSPLFALTWKIWDMPAGPLICALRASARRTSGSDCGGWGTPTAQDAKHATLSPSEMKRDPANLRNQVHTAGWATPTARDHKGGYQGGRIRNGKISTDTLDVMAQIAGRASLSTVQTENRGSLNPAFSLWLMGYPTAWASCGARVTQSSRKSQQNL